MGRRADRRVAPGNSRSSGLNRKRRGVGMSYYRNAPSRGGWGGGESLGLPAVTPVNKALMIACGVVWGAQVLLGPLLGWLDLSPLLGLVPVRGGHGWVWQLVTYNFLPWPGMYSHILFNFFVM